MLMRKDPINFFGDWALSGRDEQMAKGHEDSVNAMLDLVITNQKEFSFIDVGCGNGWVVRKIFNYPNCQYAVGVDGSKQMIAKAKSIDKTGNIISNNESLKNLIEQIPDLGNHNA